MDEYVTNSTDEPKRATESIILLRFAGICEHAGCDNRGFRYRYPDDLLATNPDSVVCCLLHTRDAGFCFSCGEFWGEVMKYKYCQGLCPECVGKFSQAIDEDSDDDDEYDDEYYD